MEVDSQKGVDRRLLGFILPFQPTTLSSQMEADQKALQPSDIVFVDTLSDIFVWIGADVPQVCFPCLI